MLATIQDQEAALQAVQSIRVTSSVHTASSGMRRHKHFTILQHKVYDLACIKQQAAKLVGSRLYLCYWVPISQLPAPLQLLHGGGVHDTADEGRHHSHADGKAHNFIEGTRGQL
jgi:hypothetical protein